MNKMKIKKFYTILYWIICLLGCCYQSYKISKIYFSYETTTDFKYENDYRIDLPGITICQPKLTQIDNDTKLKFNISSHKDYMRTFKGIPIWKELLYLGDWPKVISKCLVKEPGSMKMGDCRDVEYYASYFDDLRYCFTIFAQRRGQVDEKYYTDEDGALSAMILIHFNKTISKNNRLTLQLHDRKHISRRGTRKDVIKINLPEFHSGSISYTKTVVNYRFSPPGNPCFEGKTREECVDGCVIKKIIEVSGHFPC